MTKDEAWDRLKAEVHYTVSLLSGSCPIKAGILADSLRAYEEATALPADAKACAPERCRATPTCPLRDAALATVEAGRQLVGFLFALELPDGQSDNANVLIGNFNESSAALKEALGFTPAKWTRGDDSD